MCHRYLVAFDFDHTIVEENSDIVARKLIHEDLIPERVRKLHNAISGWTNYMSEIFKLLYQYNIGKDDVIHAMHKLTPTSKMAELLTWLKDEGHEIIIISDSNSLFISEWLCHTNLHSCVKKVFTNPASFEENGLLTIMPYHNQDWCNISSNNMCKGHILETYIKVKKEEGEIFDTIVYVGDGRNDYCPALKLTENDFLFPRAGFILESLIKTPSKEDLECGRKVVARVFPWVSALDIRDTLQLFSSGRMDNIVL